MHMICEKTNSQRRQQCPKIALLRSGRTREYKLLLSYPSASIMVDEILCGVMEEGSGEWGILLFTD